MPRLAVVIPIKAFTRAKMRLAPVLDPAARRDLARRLAAGVIAAVADHDPHVVCDDEDVRAFARQHGAGVVWAPSTDLNEAVTVAVDELAASGIDVVVVAHADLPRPQHLSTVIELASANPDTVILVPDREGLGTNVMAVPTGRGFRFAYGPNSSDRHRAEAARLGLAVRVVHDDDLGLDLDRPADLARAGMAVRQSSSHNLQPSSQPAASRETS